MQCSACQVMAGIMDVGITPALAKEWKMAAAEGRPQTLHAALEPACAKLRSANVGLLGEGKDQVLLDLDVVSEQPNMAFRLMNARQHTHFKAKLAKLGVEGIKRYIKSDPETTAGWREVLADLCECYVAEHMELLTHRMPRRVLDFQAGRLVCTEHLQICAAEDDEDDEDDYDDDKTELR